MLAPSLCFPPKNIFGVKEAGEDIFFIVKKDLRTTPDPRPATRSCACGGE